MIIAIDIGGTNIKGGLYNQVGEYIDYDFVIQTEKNYESGTNYILSQVIEEIDTIIKDAKNNGITVKGIALSSAGIINTNLGEVAYAGYTIPDYKGTPLKNAIEKAFNIPCTVLNDVNAAAYGEYWKNDIHSTHPVVYLTVGTGISGAVLLDGKLLEGYSNAAGEIGYIPVGNKTWQEIASTEALVNYYKKIKGLPTNISVTGKDIFEKYDQNETEAKLAIGYFVKKFVKGLVSVLYVVNPEYVIIGGGIFERDGVLIPQVKENLGEIIENEMFLPKEILAARQGNKASTVGAVKYFLDHNSLEVNE